MKGRKPTPREVKKGVERISKALHEGGTEKFHEVAWEMFKKNDKLFYAVFAVFGIVGMAALRLLGEATGVAP